MSDPHSLFHVWSADDGNVFCGDPQPDIILSVKWAGKLDPAKSCQQCLALMRKPALGRCDRLTLTYEFS